MICRFIPLCACALWLTACAAQAPAPQVNAQPAAAQTTDTTPADPSVMTPGGY